jgi:RHS repeat-associated protein
MGSGAARTYSYDRFNRLISVLQGGSNVMSLDYDAAGRLATTAAGAAPTDATTSQYLYDGDQPILELTGLGAIGRRFVPGPGLDNVIVQIDHDGGGVPERRWILSDDLGSVAALTDRTGKAIRFNAYGPFGEPSSGNIGRMGYAGALTLPEIGMVHLRARAYAPNLGRFIQPDPIGTAGGINLYAYAGGDPMNAVDPLGLMEQPSGPEPYCPGPLDVRCTNPPPRTQPEIIVVTAKMLEEFLTRVRRELGTEVERTIRDNLCTRGIEGWEAAGAVALGVGDSLSFGLYSQGVALIPGSNVTEAQLTSSWYKAPVGVLGSLSTGRLAYAAIAKTGAATARTWREAVDFRNDLKGVFSFTFDRHPRRKNADVELQRRGSPEAVRAAAGRTNPGLNIAAGTGASGSLIVLSDQPPC